ncbi:acyl dehydrogenase [Fusarium denticulatum]|uniref:Acyl dehydrogenase n=1 Tax=Fusarium denticulatum TaxID=48507 RepID=A0A8H5TR42_9HYPO|nr:acyl dehydrogenase [Fusarium denticulatum]
MSRLASRCLIHLRPSPPHPSQRHAFSTTPPRHLMSLTGFSDNQITVRDAISKICAEFPNTYWQSHDQDEQDPKEFHAALAKAGWLGIALPESLGGSGLGISEATMMMQTIAESGAGMAGAQSIHANVYATQPLAKFGSREQLEETIPKIVSGDYRVCFGVTEPNAGLDTLRLETVAKENSDGSFSVTGQKIWITCAQVASKMILLARTTPLDKVTKPSEGLSLFCINLNRDQPGLEMRRIKKMGGRAVDANEVFFDNYTIPASSLIGAKNKGFKMILHGMNAERCLLAGEALGLGYAALTKAATYARTRVVFKRPIGINQAIAHPLADAYMKLEAAKLATYHAARLYDEGEEEVGVAANSAKYMAAEAAFGAFGYPWSSDDRSTPRDRPHLDIPSHVTIHQSPKDNSPRMTRTPVSTKKAPAVPSSLMNQAIIANGFVFTSGGVAMDPKTGKMIEGDIEAHTRQIISNLGAILDEAGSSLNDVIEVNIYLSDMKYYAKMNEVYAEYWGDVKPARTCVAVKSLPMNANIEIKCVGVVTKPKSKL